MRAIIRLALLCVFVFPFTCAAQDSGPKYPPGKTALARELAKNPDVRQIQKQYEILARAFEAQDVAAIAGVRAADFYVDGPDGRRQGAAQMLEVLRHFFVLNKPPIRVWFTLRSVERKGPDELAVDVFQQASRYQFLADQLRKVEHDVSQRETWRRENGVWKLQSVDSIRNQHRWVDGKQIDPSKPYDPAAPPYQPPQR